MEAPREVSRFIKGILKLEVAIRNNKPGRFLSLFDIQKMAALLGAPITTVYTITLHPGAVAGNHFHKGRREVMVCIAGHVELRTEDVQMQDQSTFDLSPGEDGYPYFCIQENVAHAVRNLSDGDSVVLVFTTVEPRINKDDNRHVIFNETHR